MGSYRNRRILLQIIPFGVIPMIFSIIFSLIEKGILGDHPIYPATNNPYHFQIVLPAILSLVVGLIIGFFEVIYINRWFQKRRFIVKIVCKSLIYLSIVTIATTIIVVSVNMLEVGISPFSSEMQLILTNIFFSLTVWSIILYFGFAIVICLFYSEVSNHIGHVVLLNFFTGRYHQPIKEERVYMFVDMKSSTTFAENLGHERYFQMLKEYYVDLTEPIVRHGGEIYQYVGDEVIITWQLKDAFANNSLNCFMAMKESLSRKAPKYKEKYGVVPTFKAAIHFGKVTTGEIGVMKREIIFSGDVLNTTARIQGLCNTYQVDLLLSEKFVNALGESPGIRPVAIGEVTLRGKNEKSKLFTVALSE